MKASFLNEQTSGAIMRHVRERGAYGPHVPMFRGCADPIALSWALPCGQGDPKSQGLDRPPAGPIPAVAGPRPCAETRLEPALLR
jgi:hypothetical protein